MKVEIDCLSDDCLLVIFSNLTIIERVRLERVSSRWRRLMLKSFFSITVLNVAEFTKATYKSYHQQNNIYFVPTMESLLRKSGPRLKEISFGDRWFKICQPIVDAIATHCNRLTKLDFGSTIMDASILKTLETVAPNLIEFSLEDTHWVHTENADGIEQFFPYMVKLKKINLKRTPIDLATLPSLPENLLSTNLAGVRRLSVSVLDTFLLTHFQLTEFRLSGFQTLQQSTIDILSNVISLKTLELSCLIIDNVDLSPLGSLTNLEEMYLQSNNCLQDQSFRVICSECSMLRILNTSVCKRLFDYSALSYCKCLTHFYCSNTVQLCDEDLYEIARNCVLEHLNLTNCCNVSNTGVLAVAARCPLKEICIAQCADVNDTALIQLVNNHRPIDVISLQNCKITNDGIRAIAKLDNLHWLQELDVSYNRTVNDAAILALYQKLVTFHEQVSEAEEEKILTIHVHQTAVTKSIERLVQSHIRIMY